jgi:WhiB family redox-sensing transcriptional regulator
MILSLETWRDVAACRDHDPELFFPIGAAGPALDQVERAKQVCQRCPVREPCLRWALNHGVAFGIWGGAHRGRAARAGATAIPRVRPDWERAAREGRPPRGRTAGSGRRAGP